MYLDIWHPVVALTTYFVLDSFDRLLSNGKHKSDHWGSVMMLAKYSMEPEHPVKPRLVARLRTAAAIYLLHKVEPDRYLKPPCARIGTRTLQEWYTWAKDLTMEVTERCSAELRESACLKRAQSD